MKSRIRIPVTALTIAALLQTPLSLGASVKEPSTLPATPSHLAAQRPLMAVTMAGARIVAIGQMGHIVYSDDQGRHWLQAAVPVSVDLVSVRFQTDKKGWAGGHDGILLRTDDGGISWHQVLEGRQVAKMMQDYYAPLALSGDERIKKALDESQRFVKEEGARPFLDICFDTEQVGYVIGAWGLMLRTDDGGKTWKPWLDHVDNPRSNHLNAMARVDGQLWLVGEQGLLLRFDADLQRFVSANSPTEGSLLGITGHAGVVVVYGLAARAFSSTDQGHSWTPSKLGGTSTLTGGTVLSDGRIVLVDAGSGLWVSADSGLSFQPKRARREMSFFGVTTAADDALALVGIQGIQVEPLARSANPLQLGAR